MIRILKFLFFFFVLLLLTLWLLLKFEAIQQKIAETAENRVFHATGWHLEVNQISLHFPFQLEVGSLLLKDEENDPLLNAKRVAIFFNIASIFQDEPTILNLTMDSVEVLKIPPLPQKQGRGVHSPRLEIFVKELKPASSIFEELHLPQSLSLSSLSLKDFFIHFADNKFSLESKAVAEGFWEKEKIDLNGQFKIFKDQSLIAEFQGNYREILPFEGKFHLSPSMQIDGSGLYIRPIKIASLKELGLPAEYEYQGELSADLYFSGLLKTPQLNLNVVGPGIHLHSTFAFSLDDKWMEGKAKGLIENLSFLKHPPSFSFVSPIPYELTIPRTYGNEFIFGNLQIQKLFTDEFTINQAILEISLEDFFTAPQLDIRLFANHVAYRNFQADQFFIETSLSEFTDKHPFKWSFEGITPFSPFLLNGEGDWQTHRGDWHFHLNTLEGNIFGSLFHFPEPLLFAYKEEQFSISPFTSIWGNSDLKGAFSYEGNEIQGFFKANNFPLDVFFEKMTDFPVKGLFSLDAKLTGTAINPQIHLTVDTNQLDVDPSLKIQPHLDPLIFSLENHLLSGHGNVTLTDSASLHFDIQFPLPLQVNPPVLTFTPQTPIQGNFRAKGEITPLLQQLLDHPTMFSGDIDASFNLSGKFSDPQITGEALLTNGSYEIPEIGVVLKALTATIEANNSQLLIKDLKANDGNEGNITGTGTYLIDKNQHYPFVLELNLEEAALLNRDYIQIVCHGPLTFKGNSDEGSLISQLQVSKASVTIPECSYSTINTVEVTYFNVPENAPPPQSFTLNTPSWPLTLDIQLTVPRSLSIQGRDLDSLWKGELVVQGQAKTPLFFGELNIIRGEYLFNGNPFAINQGTVTFAGNLDKKTTLYAIASKDLDKVKVDVIAKGSIKNPAISFRSNPPLPQREILSWILFNRGTTEISPFQGVQLSESITNLSTQQQGPDVLSKIRSAFKIDRFEIGRNPHDDQEVNVQVGKYISDNILISAIKSRVNRLAVEATLTDKIKLEAQVGDDAQGQLLLKWKRDY